MARPTTFPLALDGPAAAPLYARISDAVARDIRRGRLRPGDALPGSRTLADSLGVHRSTVVAAYAELAAQGWTETRPGGATLVGALPADLPAGPRQTGTGGLPRRTAYPLEPAPVVAPRLPALPRGALALWGGVPDQRLVPVDLLARAYRRAARRHGRALLGYTSESRGHPRLRAALAALLSTARGLAASEEAVMVTRGSHMALDLIARSLLRPGDTVAVEALGYTPAFQVFRRAGARLLPIPVDERGMDVEALAAAVRRRRVRLAYLTPHHQYPTTVMLAPARRLALLELARREGIAVVEDDYDQEFHYDGRPVLPLASADRHGSVIYVGTLAKILAPGLRLGFVVAPPPLLARLSEERVLVDRQGDALLEYAVAELFEDGEIQRHVRRARRIYHARRDALCAALDARLGGALSYRRPAGGLALWAAAAPGLDVDRWAARCLERGLHFQTGRHFTLDGAPVSCLRLGFAALDERTLKTAVDRLVDGLRPPR